jgi:hypothetical protein
VTRGQLKRALREVLERCSTTTEFLQGVVSALEDLHADDEDNATSRGFEALDNAIDCFAATEADELDDDDDEEE